MMLNNAPYVIEFLQHEVVKEVKRTQDAELLHLLRGILREEREQREAGA